MAHESLRTTGLYGVESTVQALVMWLWSFMFQARTSMSSRWLFI